MDNKVRLLLMELLLIVLLLIFVIALNGKAQQLTKACAYNYTAQDIQKCVALKNATKRITSPLGTFKYVNGTIELDNGS